MILKTNEMSLFCFRKIIIMTMQTQNNQRITKKKKQQQHKQTILSIMTTAT